MPHAKTPPRRDSPHPQPDPVEDAARLVAGFAAELAKVGQQFKRSFDDLTEDAQYRFDQELAKALAKHPELCAEVRKTIRQVQRTADKAAETFGLKE